MFLQFELWKDCKHGCPFCCNKHIPLLRNKVESLKFALDKILHLQDKCDSISLIGGEFFDGQLDDDNYGYPGEVHDLFYSIIEAIADRIQEGLTDRGMVCTSIMYADSREFEYFLKILQARRVENRFLVCTSWDTAYRFTPVTRKNWERNVNLLHRMLPTTPLHVEMIMTQAFIKDYLAGKIRVKAFEKKWGCKVDFNTPYKPFIAYASKADMEAQLPFFFPVRSDYFKFLQVAHEEKDIDLTTLQNVKNHSTCLYYTMDDDRWLSLENRHDRNHTCIKPGPCQGDCCGYLDSNIRMHNDVKAFLEAVS